MFLNCGSPFLLCAYREMYVENSSKPLNTILRVLGVQRWGVGTDDRVTLRILTADHWTVERQDCSQTETKGSIHDTGAALRGELSGASASSPSPCMACPQVIR